MGFLAIARVLNSRAFGKAAPRLDCGRLIASYGAFLIVLALMVSKSELGAVCIGGEGRRGPRGT